MNTVSFGDNECGNQDIDTIDISKRVTMGSRGIEDPIIKEDS